MVETYDRQAILMKVFLVLHTCYTSLGRDGQPIPTTRGVFAVLRPETLKEKGLRQQTDNIQGNKKTLTTTFRLGFNAIA